MEAQYLPGWWQQSCEEARLSGELSAGLVLICCVPPLGILGLIKFVRSL